MRKSLIAFFMIITIAPSLVLAHSGHQETVKTDPQTLLVITFGALLSAIIPLSLGYFSYSIMRKSELLSNDQYLIPSGLVFGALIFLLFDYASLSTLFAFRIEDIVIQSVKMFLILLILILLANFTSKEQNNESVTLFYIWSLGVLVHTLGEGIIMGYNFTQGLAVAFAPFAILSFGMHKFIEGAVAAVLLCQSKDNEKSRIFKVGLMAGISILPGALLGYFAGTSEFHSVVDLLNVITFTIGFTIIVFIIPHLIPEKVQLRKENYMLAVAAGFLYMYIGIIFHEI